MGRTNPTFRDLLDATENRWSDYRRALRVHERGHFDQLFEHARAHADAAGYLNTTDPIIPMLVSMLLEHQRALADQEAHLTELQERQADQEANLTELQERQANQEANLTELQDQLATREDRGETHGLQD